MPAVSKKQQKFFGIVRSVQKGEQSPTTPEVAKAASSMKKGDVKKFASTKHKGLPEKKKIEEDRQIKKIIKQLRKSVKSHDKQADTLEKKLKNEAANPAQQAAIAIDMKKKGKKPKNINEFIKFEDAAKKREAWRKSLDNKGDFTKWKPGVNVPGVSKDIKYEPFKHNSHINPLTYKDKPVNASTVGNEIKSRAVGGIKKGLDFVKANPGKSALIGAGIIGAGMLAKKVLSRKKKKEVKEQTTFPQMQQRIRDAKERRREQQKKSEKLYMDTKRKGVKFYDKKGTGRLKDGKKVYD